MTRDEAMALLRRRQTFLKGRVEAFDHDWDKAEASALGCALKDMKWAGKQIARGRPRARP